MPYLLTLVIALRFGAMECVRASSIGLTNKEKVRISIATNIFPDDTRELEPVDTMMNEEHPILCIKGLSFLI
ncbi:hypothetical protein P3S67_006418 [Capsicum chacoense]